MELKVRLITDLHTVSLHTLLLFEYYLVALFIFSVHYFSLPKLSLLLSLPPLPLPPPPLSLCVCYGAAYLVMFSTPKTLNSTNSIFRKTHSEEYL